MRMSIQIYVVRGTELDRVPGSIGRFMVAWAATFLPCSYQFLLALLYLLALQYMLNKYYVVLNKYYVGRNSQLPKLLKSR